MAGQSIMDRVVAARHSIAGQGLAKSVCKATTEEIIGPKKKHLDYLLQCTNEPNVSIPQMADLLIERTQHTSWVVVFKALVSIHNLMNYGNERFTQYLASNNCSFNLSGFVDKGGVQGYDMSTYIRRYGKYLNEKAVSYRLMAFDFCKVKRGKDDGLLRTMNTEKLLKTLPILQQQLDALLEFDCTPNELTNGVITACFMLLFKDLIRLFACYNDGIINLLEKYFDMNKKQCKDALDLYKKFLVRMDKVSEFLKVAENMGIDKGDIPDLAKAPASLLDALEQHLASLEGKKGVATTPTSASKPVGFTSALNTMTTNTFSVSEAEKKRILDEENQQLQKLKAADETQPSVETEGGDAENIFEQKLKEASSPQQQKAPPGGASSNNPFAATSPASTSQASNLFGSPTESTAPSAGAAGRPSDDLLSLTGNPFMDNVQNVMASAYPQQTSNNPFGGADFQSNGFVTSTSSNTFTSEADFAMAFNGGTNTQAGAGFGAMPSMAPTAKAPPVGLDLGPPVDLLEGSGDGAPSPSPGLPSDFGGIPRQPSPVPASQALGSPFGGLDTAETMRASPSPTPMGGFGAPPQNIAGQSGMGMDAGLFGAPSMGPAMSMGMGVPGATQGTSYYSQQPPMGGGIMGSPAGMRPAAGYYQAQGQSMPMNIPGTIGARPPMGPVAPGSPSLGLGGSPVRIMTRGGKSPATSVSSSPSGPGLEDAVKALGLTMSPSKGGAGKTTTKPGSRPLSPGQPMMGGGVGGVGMSSSPGTGGMMEAPGSYFGGGDMGGVGGQPQDQGYGTQDQEVAGSGQGFDAFGDVLQPINKSSPSQTPQSTQQGKALGKDLDSSLASLASNLNVRGGATAAKKDHQWQPKGESKLTGGNAFQRPPMAQTSTTPWGAGGQGGFVQPNMMGAPGAPMMYNQPQMGGQWGMGQPMGMGMQPGMGMGAPGMYGAQRMPMMGGAPAGGFQQPRPQQPPGQSNNVNDPFGAL